MNISDKYNILEFLLFPPVWLNGRNLQQKLEGKTVLITGASYGIGESLAYELARTNAHLILVARTEEKLLQIKTEIEARGGQVSIIPTDLSKPEEVAILLQKLHQLPSGVDIVINNAGKSILRSIQDSLDRYHDFTRTMAINYFGPVQLMLSLIPVLEKKHGHVINVSAINVLLAPAPFWAAYQASKAAFDNWFRSVAPELNALGIQTTSIYLPLVKTRMIEPTAAYRNMPAMKPEHVAKLICQSIVRERKYYAPWWLIFGQLSSVIFRRPWEALLPYFIKNKKSHL